MCIRDSYYGEDQLMEAERIQALKGMGFALSIIREILEKYEEPEEMERFLLIKKKELEEESLETQQRIRPVSYTHLARGEKGNEVFHGSPAFHGSTAFQGSGRPVSGSEH